MDTGGSEKNQAGREQHARVVSPARERQRQVREEVILDAARTLISRVGYDAMTMDDLAAQAGISKPTLYQHFPSKEAVAVRSVCSLMSDGLDAVHRLDPSLPALAKIERIVRHFVYQKFVERRYSLGSARAALIPVVRSSPEYQRVRDGIVTAMEKFADQAKVEGAVDPSLSSRVLAQVLFSLLRDWEYEELIERGECPAEQVAETLVTVALRGMCAAPIATSAASTQPTSP